MSEYIISAYGRSGRQWALTIECEDIQQVIDAVVDLELMTNLDKDIGELIKDEL